MKRRHGYQDNGAVRDHKVAFVRTLFERPEQVYRDVAWALFQGRKIIFLLNEVGKNRKRRRRERRRRILTASL